MANICFFSENSHTGKILRNYPNMRTEFAWQCALEADHHNLTLAPKMSYDLPEYDLGLVILPKNKNVHLKKIRDECRKLAIVQEGPNDYWHEYNLEDQNKYLEALDLADMILVHNEIDADYFSGITNKNCYVLRSLMITDALDPVLDIDKRLNNCMIGGGFSNWYGGRDSYEVAKIFEALICCPAMGRNSQEEHELINVLPYVLWRYFQNALNYCKYAVHLMRTIAAGTFMLNCAHWQIPCISYNLADSARICHPYTSVNLGNIREAKKIAYELKNDPEFYKMCSEIAKKKYEEEFSEKVWLKRWNEIIEKENLC